MAVPDTSVIISSLLAASRWWSGSTITYSVPREGSTWPAYGPGEEPTIAGYGVLNAAQAQQFSAAIAAWDKVVAVNFVQTDDLASPGQIRAAFTDVDALSEEDLWGYAYYPPSFGGAGSPVSGDIWIDQGHLTSDFALGGNDFSSLVHEIGHAIGLKHPFEDGAVLPAEYDTSRYTLMSYTDAADSLHWRVESTATGVRIIPTRVAPETPMVFDVLAAQARYGADPTTAAGNTVYSWDQNRPFFQTIYDAGGVDTFDLSNHSRGSIIDMSPGGYSSIAQFSAQAQIAEMLARFPWARDFFNEHIQTPETYTWSDNLGIAYNTVIENVIGGPGADTILGNAAANEIRGGDGTSYLRGFDGNDRIWGGSAFDDLHGNVGDDTLWGAGGDDWVVGGKDDDVLYGDAGNDIVYGNIGNDTGYGGDGNDQIRGGQNNDLLYGGAGNDWMSGDKGDDTLIGGAGADIFNTFGEAGLDRVMDFNSAEGDRVRVEPGTVWELGFSGSDAVITMVGGAQMILVGVTAATLGDWLIA
ncbi:M10 family metallopeptidase [Phenylobacterium sp.]|uniref:M10 family metallopeptidase n=1 Tax=Phenylobacterium sp. TaxID=1871053 RepID=UPI002731B035|nr:M10 family metallopeptidase [Phenylobacterium sp.]MDP1618777.1 M10 family metallopeptidase [Phenylobacterium sp.]MDP1985987.1 M10 family metallopeptidase [Phenylobacterium sp.]